MGRGGQGNWEMEIKMFHYIPWRGPRVLTRSKMREREKKGRRRKGLGKREIRKTNVVLGVEVGGG
jgi:hypothetical protein